VVGYGDFTESAYFSPTLTTVRVPPGTISEDAIDVLVRMRKDKEDNFKPMVTPVEFVQRQSTGPVTVQMK
jgi:DNA-binding LacI/PurR family transcriptional regulator